MTSVLYFNNAFSFQQIFQTTSPEAAIVRKWFPIETAHREPVHHLPAGLGFVLASICPFYIADGQSWNSSSCFQQTQCHRLPGISVPLFPTKEGGGKQEGDVCCCVCVQTQGAVSEILTGVVLCPPCLILHCCLLPAMCLLMMLIAKAAEILHGTFQFCFCNLRKVVTEDCFPS